MLREDKFIVDGIHHDWQPGKWDQVYDLWGVRTNTQETLNLRNVVVTKKAPISDTDSYIDLRLVWRQAWNAQWDQQSLMSPVMRDHLFVLYTLQKGFWLQFDDEMTRCKANLFTVGSDYKSYFTPTYPIAPYKYEPTDRTFHNGNIFTIDSTGLTRTYWNNFTVDNEVGMVRFNDALTSLHKVQMSYTWKCFVRILEFNITPFDLAQNCYIGNIIFEQIRPDYTKDPWFITLPGPCGNESEVNYTPGTSGTGYSNGSGGTYGTYGTDTVGWGDSRYTLPASASSIISIGSVSEPV